MTIVDMDEAMDTKQPQQQQQRKYVADEPRVVVLAPDLMQRKCSYSPYDEREAQSDAPIVSSLRVNFQWTN